MFMFMLFFVIERVQFEILFLLFMLCVQLMCGLYVLLVEDNVDMVEVMLQMLEIFGYSVVVVNGVCMVMQVVEFGMFDLLISDIGLLDGSGLDVVCVFVEW